MIRRLPLPPAVKFSALLLSVATVLLTVALIVINGEQESVQNDERRIKQAIQTLRIQLGDAKKDKQLLQDMEDQYLSYQEKSIDQEQNRLAMIRLLEELRTKHRLTELSYNFSAAVQKKLEIKDPFIRRLKSKKIKQHYVMETPVKLEVGAYLDTDVFAFIENLRERAPGIAVVSRLALKATPTVSPRTIQAIRQGKSEPLVEGDIHLLWRSAPLKKKEAAR